MLILARAEKFMNRPVWFLNLCLVLGTRSLREDPLGYFYALTGSASMIHGYLDKTMVKGNAEAEAVVRVLCRMVFRHSDFTLIPLDSGSNAVHRSLYGLAKRLKGLASQQGFVVAKGGNLAFTIPDLVRRTDLFRWVIGHNVEPRIRETL